MSRNSRSSPTENGVFAVAHHAAGSWRILVARRSNGRLEIVETRRFGEHEAGDLQPFLERTRAARIITVIPSSGVVCRSCTLPDAAPEELDQALALQAETHLIDTAEAHRIAYGVLQIAPGESSRTGIIVSWPQNSTAVVPNVALPITFAPDVAALTALLNGYRPAEPLFWADRSTGSVALALTHAAGAVIRTTREDGDTVVEWTKNATRVLAETALSVGHSGAFAQSLVESHKRHLTGAGEHGATFLLPPEVIQAVSETIDGTGSTDEWWSDFGIATGIAIAATGDLAALTMLEGERAIERPSRIEAVTRMLSRPRTALVTTIVCLIVIALVPLAASGLRLAVLEQRYPDIEQRTRAIGRTESHLAMYAALDKQSWSMTKLLADVVSNTPEGIELDSIRLQHSDESVFVSGRAVGHDDRTATEVIASMQEVMRDSGLFAEIKLNWDEGTNMGHHEFELSAKISAPHRRVKYDIAQDFAKWTLAQRQGGEGPSTDEAPPDIVAAAESTPVERTPAPPVAQDDPPPVTERPAPTRRSPADVPRSGIGGAAKGAADPSSLDDRRGTGPAPGAVPAPLTKGQIKAMSLAEASAALVEVAKAKNRLSREDDPVLFDRLTQEFKLLMARKREGM